MICLAWAAIFFIDRWYHSQGGTIDEARGRIREALSLCAPGADKAGIVDVVQPGQGAVLNPPTCPYCGGIAVLAQNVRRYRRGERVVRVQVGSWECMDCRDPFTGERPFRFSDRPMVEKSDADARWAWRAVYGEPMPEPTRVRRTGMPKGAARVIEAALAGDAMERGLAPGQAAPNQLVVQALWGDGGLGVTFADGLRVRVPAVDVMRGHRYPPSAIKLADVAPFGVMIRFGRRQHKRLPWDWLRRFAERTG